MNFLKTKHVEYVKKIQQFKEILNDSKSLTDHMNIPGAYWTLATSFLLKLEITQSDKEKMVDFVLKCQNKDYGFGGSIDHDSCVTHTLYSLIILMLFDELHKVDLKKISEFVMSLYQESEGAFKGSQYGEIDARFCFSALYILKITGNPLPIKCSEYFKKCKNFDGGFGGRPDAESHAAYIYCVVGGYAILDKIEEIDKPSLARFLSIRQTVQGGFNGRPEKLPDVCYSWWVLSSIQMFEEIDIIDTAKLEEYIIACQDPEIGGFSDRPGNGNDVFHTFFAIAALSLINKEK